MALGSDLLNSTSPTKTVLVLAAVAWLSWHVIYAFSTAYLSPLSKFPGPRLAALTRYWHAFVECILNRSFYDVLVGLHKKHGEVVRIGPNELHFSNPQAYHDIYNNQNRWDKEKRLYHSFGEDRSSFGYLTYKEAKPRKDILSKRFSPKAVLEARDLVQDKIDALCKALDGYSAKGEHVKLGRAFRCMTLDIITYLCFGKSVDAINEPNFDAPMLIALDSSIPVMLRFKHSDAYKNMIQGCPPNIARVIAPESKGLIDLQQLLGAQIQELSQEPRKLDLLPHDLTIYHVLMSPDAGKNHEVPSAGSLYEEAQALMFAGADTVGNTMMIISYFLSQDKKRNTKLRAELQSAWSANANQPPSPSTLESLPYFNAVIKEGLRYSHGVVAGLLRVVPKEGATIAGTAVPGGTIVSCASPFVHWNEDIFEKPYDFNPERWIEDPGLDRWLVSFSKGPRSCLGINLGWLELRMTLSTIYTKFNIELDESSPKQLTFRDGFLPAWSPKQAIKARFSPILAH